MKKIAIISGRGIGDFFTLLNFLFSLSQNNNHNQVYIFLDNKIFFSEFINYFHLPNIQLVEIGKKNLLRLLRYRKISFDYIISRYPASSAPDFLALCLRGKRLTNKGSFWSRFFDFTIPIDQSKKIEEQEKKYLDFMGIEYKKFSLPKLALNHKEGIIKIGMHWGARKGYELRLWPTDKWLALIEYLHSRYQIQFNFFGGKEDEILYESILTRYNNINFVNQAGILALPETFQKIEEMDIFVSTNSGLMHMAAAWQIPQVALCGPSRLEWEPYNSEALVVRKIVERKYCQPPCDSDKCRYKDNLCVKAIGAQEVIDNVEQIIHKISKIR